MSEYDDLVKRLRENCDGFGDCEAEREYGEAADAITQLQDRMKELELKILNLKADLDDAWWNAQPQE